MKITHKQAYSALVNYIKAGIVPMLLGSPGIGKSQLVYQLAEMFRLKVIDFRLSQCDPTDLGGFLSLQNGRASYLPLDTFPIEGDPIPDGYDGWLIFLDEMTSAARAVQAASYKLLLDRMVGQNKLHSKVVMVGAGNLETDNAIVEPMSTALISRVGRLELELDPQEWIEWATSNGWDHRITDFIKFKTSALYTFDPEYTDAVYASPRTWEFANRLIKDESDISHLRAELSGIVSEGIASEFSVFTRIYDQLPKPEEIINNPMGANIPDGPDVIWAISGSLATMTNEMNAAQVLKYIARLPGEFQVLTVKEMLRRTPKLSKHEAIKEWKVNTAEAYL